MKMSSFHRFLPVLGMMVVLFIGMTEPASAQALGGVESVLQNIVDVLTGNLARLLGIVAVILTGIAWMFNIVDLRAAGMVVFGLAIVFGAAEIVDVLAGTGTT